MDLTKYRINDISVLYVFSFPCIHLFYIERCRKIYSIIDISAIIELGYCFMESRMKICFYY